MIRLLALRFGMPAVAVLLVVFMAWGWLMHATALQSKLDAAQEKALQAQQMAREYQSSLDLLKTQLEAAQAAEQARVEAQREIEGARNARRERNTAIVVKHAEVADIVLPDDILDGLRDK